MQATIKRITRIDSEDRYDISVEKNENFFANDILVHNCRLLALVDDAGDTKFYSREGMEYTTMGMIAQDIKRLGFKNCVLDGECCIVDSNGDEDFRSITRLAKKKDFTIPNPMYMIFDMLTHEEFESQKGTTPFSKRSAKLREQFAMNGEGQYMSMMKQTLITSQKQFDDVYDLALEKGWEGLVIREDVGYEGKRTNHLLKVKEMTDAEYEVLAIQAGPFQYVVKGRQKTEQMMTNVLIMHKGVQVSVGSGFSIAERKEFFKNPKAIVGKKITVQYFQETENDQGTISLRFPIYKGIRDYE